MSEFEFNCVYSSTNKYSKVTINLTVNGKLTMYVIRDGSNDAMVWATIVDRMERLQEIEEEEDVYDFMRELIEMCKRDNTREVGKKMMKKIMELL